MRDELEVDAELLRGSGGIFEVAVDGRVVAAKKLGQFPDERDVVEAVATALGK